jgi:glycosyltransferase involved in cell wall biosynthesis
LATSPDRTEKVEPGVPRNLHVLTLTPFYPSRGDDISGCFIAEPLREVEALGAASSVIAVNSIYHSCRESSCRFPAEWVRSPQLPGNFGLSSAGNGLAGVLSHRVSHLHRRWQVDVIHAHAALPCGHAASILSKKLGIPYVVTVHGLDVFNSCFQTGITARWRRESSRRVYRSAAAVICISKKVRQMLIEEESTAPRTEVVYNGTSTEMFLPDITSAEPSTILVVGNLLAGKGQELVLRAFARIGKLHPALRCTLIGEGADRDRLIALTKDLGISDRVEFLGRRSREEVAAAMRNCTIFILPSRYEGLGCVYLEAMASAKPVIACHGQGIDEIIHHGRNGWLIPVDGLEPLVEGMQTLLSNAALRASIGNAARQTILDGLTMKLQARKLMSIYQNVAR